MNPSLHADILNRLSEFQFKPEQGGFLRGGVCPQCQKKELYVHATNPWILRCNRLSKCGYEEHVKQLYPDLFNNWRKRYAAQLPNNPNAIADAYLEHGRGFELERLHGLYTQESYVDSELNLGSATVRFKIGNGHWERFIDQPERFGNKKARFTFGTNYQGLWWISPTSSALLTTIKEVWLTEGVFNAIALEHHGIAAAAIMSCSNYPHLALAELRKGCDQLPQLVWALDNDIAGQNFLSKHIERARKEQWTCTAALPPKGKTKIDWNDLHQRNRLTPDDIANSDAPAIQKYLIDRADGINRINAKLKSGITIPNTTLISIEWNALTYAGHTVWNVHNERTENGYINGTKRRPREDWVIQKNTHEALISEEQAELILNKLGAKTMKRTTRANYLLTNLLSAPDNQSWHGDGTGKYYRLGKGKKVRCDELDSMVLSKISRDLSSPEFIRRITQIVKASLRPKLSGSQEKEIQSELHALNKKIEALTVMLTETSTPAVLLRQIEKYEVEREALERELEDAKEYATQAKIVDALTEKDIKHAIAHNIEALETLDRDDLKELLGKLIDTIMLNPADLSCSINYRIQLDRGDKMASPRGFEPLYSP